MPHVDPNDESTYQVCVIDSELSQTKIPKHAILDAAEACGFDEDSLFGMNLALEEALTNAVKHGNKHDASKKVTVKYCVTEDVAVVCICDEGEGFNPDKVPDPTAPERIEMPCGRGIMLVKNYMDEVEHRQSGREIRFLKRKADEEK